MEGYGDDSYKLGEILTERKFEVKCPFCGSWFNILIRVHRDSDEKLVIKVHDEGSGVVIVRRYTEDPT